MPANERTPLLSDAQSMAQQAKPDLLHIAKILGALQAGKLPTQSQIDRAIDALTSKRSILSPDRRKGEGKLSENGRTILEDVKTILQKLKTWSDSKNKGDVLQELIYHTKRGSLDADGDVNIDVKAPASSSEVKKDANDFTDTIRSLARLVYDQVNILKTEAVDGATPLGGELILLLRDLLADAAEEVSHLADEAASELRPKEGEEGKIPSKEDVKQKGKEVQDKAQKEGEKGKERLNKEAGPVQDKAQEAKDKAIDRLIQVANRIQKDDAYKKAFEQLFSLARKYYKKTGEAIEATAESAKVDGDVYGNEHTNKAVDAFKQLLSNFANGRPADNLVTKAKKVFEDIKNDERLSNYIEDVEKFVQKLLEDPDYATSKAPRRDAGKLHDRGQELLKDNAQWKEDTSAFLSEVDEFKNAIRDDPEAKAVKDAFEKLGTDTKKLAKVGAGMFKGQAGAFYRDAVNVVLPRALSLINEIPIPRTEFKSKDIEFVIDNFTITSASFIPDNLRVTSHSEFGASRIGKSDASASLEASTRVRFDGLRFQAKDVSFWVRRPGAVLFSEESGLLDLNLTGEGLSGDLQLALADEEEDDETFFKVVKSNVSLKSLSLKIHDNYHYILTFLFTPILNTALRSALSSALSAYISDSFEMLDWRAFDLRRRVNRYETQGYTVGQAYARALSEPSPSASTGPSPFAGLHSTSKGFIRDDRGPHDAQIAIGGEQLFPGKKGPKSSLDRAAKKANQAVDGVARDLDLDGKKKKVQANAPNVSGQDVQGAKKQANQFSNLVRDEFDDAQNTADAQRRAEEDDEETWKSDVFNL